MTTPEDELQQHRKAIDAIDDQLIALLNDRAQIVRKVGALKHRAGPVHCPIRSGREAQMVRRIQEQFKNGPFPAAAAVAMWRLIISASTSIEEELKIAVYAPDNEMGLFVLTREYFGGFTTIIRHPNTNRVVGDVLDGKANVGILPMPREEENGQWWLSMIQGAADLPRIFAQIPVFAVPSQERFLTPGLAIARVEPEPSGKDTTYLVVESDLDTSMHRLKTVFTQIGLDATWIGVTNNPSTRSHLVSVPDFIASNHPKIADFTKEMGASVLRVHVLGSAANPIPQDNNHAKSEDDKSTASLRSAHS